MARSCSPGRLIAKDGSYTITLNSDAECLAEGGDLAVTSPVLINGTIRATGDGDQAGHDVVFCVVGPLAASAGLVKVDDPNTRVLFNAGRGQTLTGDLDFRVEDGVLELAAVVELWVRYELTIDTDGIFRFNADDGQTLTILPARGATGPLEISAMITLTDRADGDAGPGTVRRGQLLLR